MQQSSTAHDQHVHPAIVARVALHSLAKNWWMFLLRGLFAVAFGVLCFVLPGVTLVTLTLLFGAYAVIDGVLAIIGAFRGEAAGSRWWLVVLGAAGIIAGLVAFAWPGLTALVLLFVIAAWSIASGVMQIYGAIRLRKAIDNEWLLIASGALSIIFGLLLLAQPATGAVALIFVIGFFAVLYGILLTLFSLRLRRHARAVS